MGTTRKKLPARTPEGRMNQLIDLAVTAAEEKLKNGTASSQIITLLLGLATTKAQLEIEKLRADVQVQNAKARQINNADDMKELYGNALSAMMMYQGRDAEEEDLYD